MTWTQRGKERPEKEMEAHQATKEFVIFQIRWSCVNTNVFFPPHNDVLWCAWSNQNEYLHSSSLHPSLLMSRLEYSSPIPNYLLCLFTNLPSISSVLSCHHIPSLRLCVVSATSVKTCHFCWNVPHSVVAQAEREPLMSRGNGRAAALLCSRRHIVTKDFEVINNVSCLWISSQLLPFNWLGHTP